MIIAIGFHVTIIYFECKTISFPLQSIKGRRGFLVSSQPFVFFSIARLQYHRPPSFILVFVCINHHSV